MLSGSPRALLPDGLVVKRNISALKTFWVLATLHKERKQRALYLPLAEPEVSRFLSMPQHPGPAVPPTPLSTSAGPFRDLQQPQVNGATSHSVLCITSPICGQVQARPWGCLVSCFESELFPQGCPAPEDTGVTTSDPRPRATISPGPKPIQTHLDADLPSIRLHVALLSQKVCFARIPFSKLKIYWMSSVR